MLRLPGVAMLLPATPCMTICKSCQDSDANADTNLLSPLINDPQRAQVLTVAGCRGMSQETSMDTLQ